MKKYRVRAVLVTRRPVEVVVSATDKSGAIRVAEQLGANSALWVEDKYTVHRNLEAFEALTA